MPVNRTCKKHGCDHPNCEKAFARPCDLERHKRIHCEYEERQFTCSFAGCDFRANQQGGIKQHFNSLHANVRLPCDEPGCAKTFSDPSSRTKHRQKFHGAGENTGRRAHSRKKKRSAAYPMSVHARVARHVVEHSQQDAEDVLKQFATFVIRSSDTSNAASPPSDDLPSDPDTGPSASHGASTSVYRPNYIIHPQTQLKHQEYDACLSLHWGRRLGYYPDTPVPSRPKPTFGHLRQPSWYCQEDREPKPFMTSLTDCKFGSLTMAEWKRHKEGLPFLAYFRPGIYFNR